MSNHSKTYYLIRHGQTQAAADAVIGCTDVALSKLGKKVAKKLNKTRPHDETLSIHTSALMRAKETARLMHGDVDIDCNHSALINEMDFGDWEEKTWDSAHQSDPEFFNYWAQNWMQVAPPGGECFNDVVSRCNSWLDKIKQSPESAIIVAHGGSLRALLCLMLNLPFDSAFNFDFHHCHVSKINYSDGEGKAVYINSPVFV